ncbi:MAG: protein kinase [Myxococcota bacterium]
MRELQPGQTIAGYEIVRYVRSGGMASLYLGRRHGAAGFSKPVAIKIVHPHLAREPRFVQMFLDEARLASLIDHPNVVRTEELLEDAGTYMMVMEFVHGVSLFQLLKRLADEGRRLGPDLVAFIGAQIADGLHAAHETRGDDGQLLDVVHRDVSPQNVLLSWSGHVKLIDFGVAKSLAKTNHTAVGVIRGKVGYMAPEQATARPVDRRTDVYALGIVLWEMLTSRRLFRAASEVELLDQVRSPCVPPPSEVGAVPPALEAAVLRALAPAPEGRMETGQALRDALLAAQPGARGIHAGTLGGLLDAVLPDLFEPAPLRESDTGSAAEWEASRTGSRPVSVSRPGSLPGTPASRRMPASYVAEHTRDAPGARFTDGEFDADGSAPTVPPASIAERARARGVSTPSLTPGSLGSFTPPPAAAAEKEDPYGAPGGPNAVGVAVSGTFALALVVLALGAVLFLLAAAGVLPPSALGLEELLAPAGPEAPPSEPPQAVSAPQDVPLAPSE